jgi:AcrR family transcriptional regulator
MARRAPPETKAILLRSARACFVEKGLDDTTIEAITTHAGVAKGAFYSYFESKDECWRLILGAFLSRLETALLASDPSAQAATTPNAGLAHILRILELCWEERAFVRMLLAGRSNAGAALAHTYLLDELANGARRRSTLLRARSVAAGEGRADLDPELVARFVAGGYEALVRDLVQRPKKPDIAEWCRIAEQTWLCGFLTDAARARQLTEAASGAPATQKPKRAPRKR